MNKLTCVEYAAKVKEKLKSEVSQLDRKPHLSIIQVGNNQASNTYVKGKIKDCEEVGIEARLTKIDEGISYENFCKEIANKNDDPNVDGIIVQLPLPEHLKRNFMNNISPLKDVDGFRSDSCHDCCTTRGIINYLKESDIEIEGKNCVVIGRSEIVGKPMARMLLEEDATVTVCHSKTRNLELFTKNADIIIVAVGKMNVLNGNMVKEGVIVVDVGINRDSNGKLCGDCDYDSLVSKCELITPVPGGVGRLTRIQLLSNVLEAQKFFIN